MDKGGEQTVPRSLLHGVPVVLQDNINIEGLLAGSRRGQSTTLYGAAVTRKLRAAGAVVVAKVNANDEFGWASMSESTLSGGQTRNPHNLDYIPGGSDFGSETAVAANYAPLSVGVDVQRVQLSIWLYCFLSQVHFLILTDS